MQSITWKAGPSSVGGSSGYRILLLLATVTMAALLCSLAGSPASVDDDDDDGGEFVSRQVVVKFKAGAGDFVESLDRASDPAARCLGGDD